MGCAKPTIVEVICEAHAGKEQFFLTDCDCDYCEKPHKLDYIWRYAHVFPSRAAAKREVAENGKWGEVIFHDA